MAASLVGISVRVLRISARAFRTAFGHHAGAGALLPVTLRPNRWLTRGTASHAHGKTPLWTAAVSRDLGRLQAELKVAGVDVNAGKGGLTPLYAAVTRLDQSAIDALLTAGADPNRGDSAGWNAVLAAANVGDVVRLG